MPTNDIRQIRPRPITFGSLFAGIGGIDLGLERAGMRCLWQVEKDDYASKVLAKHWPPVARFRDVRDCGAGNLDTVDLIAGGFPCQPHSLAGKRKASADDRDLWGEFARIICELRPRWVLAENVPGLLSSENGRFFGRVLGDLAALGYDAEWHCIPAAAVGAPHIRERIFVLAYPDSERQQKQRRAEPTPPYRARVLTNIEYSDQWTVEPGICRMAHGVPNRIHRIRGLGNACVPQVIEFIGKQIVAMHEAQYAHE